VKVRKDELVFLLKRCVGYVFIFDDTAFVLLIIARCRYKLELLLALSSTSVTRRAIRAEVVKCKITQCSHNVGI